VNRKTILLLLGVPILAFFYHRGITLSDEYLYTLHAFQLSEGTFELSPSAFHNRFGMLVPMAILMKCLGPIALYIYALATSMPLIINRRNSNNTSSKEPNLGASTFGPESHLTAICS
jgi:hypothetical protein